MRERTGESWPAFFVRKRGDEVLDKCIGCVWACVTMRDDYGVPIQIYCPPHPDGCPKGEPNDNKNDQTQA